MFGRCGTRLQKTQAQTVLAENPSQIIFSSVSERSQLKTTLHSCGFFKSPLNEPKYECGCEEAVRACLSERFLRVSCAAPEQIIRIEGIPCFLGDE
jgi:hypothetical protein